MTVGRVDAVVGGLLSDARALMPGAARVTVTARPRRPA